MAMSSTEIPDRERQYLAPKGGNPSSQPKRISSGYSMSFFDNGSGERYSPGCLQTRHDGSSDICEKRGMPSYRGGVLTNVTVIMLVTSW